ncbi:isoaspartyl peptidase/L-asparaginase [Myroides guanonis]|uniref:L-asparaginase n=1 Tax=Myroides guanonis TaxID=1150112 RepID=A0A1I3TXK9_9FLAO|nr:isoaspartyl peptidase/L-asparaginase [Myroides guanonis]SFJ75039.1 L-asparaginase [Myroides guanonis]
MKIIIHGGFFSEYFTDKASRVQKQKALKTIVKKGFDFLTNHSAVETVAYTVSLLEKDPLFNAGTGSQIQSDGIIRMSAAIMDGQLLKMAGVVNIEEVEHPILIAQKLLDYEDKTLGGLEATAFARKLGFKQFNPETKQRREEYENKKLSLQTSTVGCVCLDKNGHIAVATSTGGKGFETPGRISDSSTVAGTYANTYCGISLTGIGEDIVNNAMAAKIVTRVTDGMNIQHAFEKSFNELKEQNGFAGAIGIDKHGHIYHQDSEPTMVYASYDGELFDVF